MRDQHPRVLFSCVAENRPAFATMAHSLALSIRGFAGALANAAIVVNFVDGVEPRFAAPLEALGVQLRIVPRVSAANPLANKLRMLELHAEHEFDVLVALDCDVIVVGDPSPWIDPGRIAAKAADFDRFDDDEWRRLFDVVRVPVPERTLTATATGQRTYPYFNSGVVLVPHDALRAAAGRVARDLRRPRHRARRRSPPDPRAVAVAGGAGVALARGAPGGASVDGSAPGGQLPQPRPGPPGHPPRAADRRPLPLRA